jgi:predicted GNAT superfamily acetyltransferase
MHTIRQAVPSDYDRIIAVVDEWWGRPISGSLPRLFLDHFHRSSFIADAPDGSLAGFLVGFASPSAPRRAYIHFVGVAPAARTWGLGRSLYEDFFDLARNAGCDRVNAITASVNLTSIAFHTAMGFDVKGPVEDYDGPGTRMMVFERELS